MAKYIPFMVRVRLGSPVLFSTGSLLTLDAILASLLFKKTQDVTIAHTEIPLERTGIVWHGSAFFPIDPLPYGVKFKSDVSPLLGHIPPYVDAPNSILRVGGKDKPTIDQRDGYIATQGYWFGCGDIDEVASLLDDLTNLGKKSNQGFGVVDSIKVIPMKHDGSVIFPDKSPARPIPLEVYEGSGFLGQYSSDRVCCEPPYWQMNNQYMSALPTFKHLTMEHIEFIDSDATETLPLLDIPVEGSPTKTGIEYFYENIGEKLSKRFGKEGVKKGAALNCNACGSEEGVLKTGGGYTSLCAPCRSLGGGYEVIKRPGRMGAGWFGLVKEEKSVLVTSYDYKSKNEAVPFEDSGVELRCGTVEIGRLFWEIVDKPPKPPFLFFSSGNSSVKVIKDLHVTWSLDRCYLSGGESLCVNLDVVKVAVNAWRKSGIAPTSINRARYLFDRLNTSIKPYSIEKAQLEWDKLIKKTPALVSLMDSIPASHTDEFQLYSRVSNWEFKNG